MRPGRMRMRGTGAKPKNLKKTVLRLLSYINGKTRLMFFVVLGCILVSALAALVPTLFIRTLIDDYIAPLLLSSAPDFSGLLRAILSVAAISLVGVLALLMQSRLMVTISQRVLKTIRDTMFSHMQTLPVKYFDTHTHGEVMSHYTNDADTLRQMISQTIPQLFSSLITIISVFAAMVSISIYLTLMVLCFLVLMLFVTKKVGGKSAKYFVLQQKSLAKTNGYIEELINGQKVVKVFCHERAAEGEFDETNDELFENAEKANRYANIFMPIMGNIGHLQYVMVAIAGGLLALGGIGGLTLGGIASFLTLSRNFSMPISQIAQQLNSVVMAFAGAERIFTLMDEPAEEDNGTVTLVNAEYRNEVLTKTDHRTDVWAWEVPDPKTGTVHYVELKGDVRFTDVDFGYNDDTLVLHDISLFAKPGQKIAFVGATGAGKTTITNLINRFYDIADGDIRYDGIPIHTIRKTALRRSLGIVLQDTNLFTGTVMENIRYGRLDATDDEVISAAKLANAHGFISRLPNGYQTEISGDGGSLSQGQRQLLSIARAAVADPPVMILDEATSSIDTRTEAIVQTGMDQLMEGRTVFVIAHRLSTVQNAKAILVLEDGRIIERGDHATLLKEKGTYYQFYTGAFG